MAAWMRTLNMRKGFNDFRAGNTTISELAFYVARSLKALDPYKLEEINEQLDDLVDMFDGFARSGSDDVDEFDDMMNELYDWADQKLDSTWPGTGVAWVITR